MEIAGEWENRWLTWKHTRQTGTVRQETQRSTTPGGGGDNHKDR